MIKNADFRLIQFTGSSQVAEHLSKITHGKVRIEDAGFNWKVLGPDVKDFEYVCWQSDQMHILPVIKNAAGSVVFVHENWLKAKRFVKK